MNSDAEQEDLKDQFSRIIEEARMMLPGIQALFGFQTIAVFNERFEKLPVYAQDFHAAALALVVIAIALVMLPAAYHRIAEPKEISQHTIRISSRAITYALAPLAAALSLDIVVVLYLVTGRNLVSALGGGSAFALLICLWFVYPLCSRRSRRHGAPH